MLLAKKSKYLAPPKCCAGCGTERGVGAGHPIWNEAFHFCSGDVWWSFTRFSECFTKFTSRTASDFFSDFAESL